MLGSFNADNLFQTFGHLFYAALGFILSGAVLHKLMQIGCEQWQALVINGAAQLGVDVRPSQAELLARHCQLLLEWNRKFNLTAITDPGEMAVKHVLDALAPVAHIPNQGHLLDIGTGGGFPGIPLKVLRPDQNMTLIDASRKKINFIKHVIRQLQLERIQALHARAEDLAGQSGGCKRFHVIVCRALGSLEDILRLAAPLILPGGRLVALKGPREAVHASAVWEQAPESKQDAPDRCYFKVTSHSYRLPFQGDSRSLIVLQSCPKE